MKSFILGIGLTGSVVAATIAGVGCGGDDTGSGGSAGAGGASSSVSSTSTQITTGPTSTTTTGSGGMGQGHTFDTALPITVNDMTPAAGSLPDPTSSQDFYKFTGTAGEKVAIVTTAKPTADGFDATYLDLVVTLYDASQKQIAR